VLYVSGNSINAADLSNLNEPEGETHKTEESEDIYAKLIGECPGESHTKVLVAERQITSYAIYPKESIIAYTERNSNCIKIFKWSQMSGITTLFCQLEASEDIGIGSLTFSQDGNYLASLGSMPTFRISVWEWRSQKQLCSTPNGCPSQFLTFNPLDGKQLCTSGVGNRIRFWKLKVGFKRYTLVPVDGQRDKVLQSEENNLLFPDQLEDYSAQPFEHAWAAGKTVYASSHDGTEIYKYNADKGSMEVLVSSKAISNQEESNWQHILPCSKNILAAGKDGKVRWYNLHGGLVRTICISASEPIAGMIPSANFRQIVLPINSEKFFVYNPSRHEVISVRIPSAQGLTTLAMFPLDKMMVSAHRDGLVQFWNSENVRLLRSFRIPTTISFLAVSPVSMTMAVGSTNGFVRIYSVPNILYQPPKLVMKVRAHQASILKMEYEGNGQFLATAGNDGTIFLFNTWEMCKPLGYFQQEGKIQSIQWEKNEEDVSNVNHAKLFVLSTLDESSSINVYHVPIQQPLETSGMLIQLQETETQLFRLEKLCTDFFVAPKHLIAGKYIFYLSSEDQQTRVYAVSSSAEKSNLTNPIFESAEHRSGHFRFASSNNGEWLITMGTDGLVTLRSLIESEKVVKIQAHAYQNGTVIAAALTLNSKHLYSAGVDGLLRRWDWKLTPTNRRAALEAMENAERVETEERAFIDEATQKITDLPSLEDQGDSLEEKPLSEGKLKESASTTTISAERQAFKNQMVAKLNSLTERILKMISKNELVPSIERLDRQEFVVDLREKSLLLAETEKQLQEIKENQERENLKKRILKKRIKEQCWDSMEVIGQAVKSFKVDSVLGKKMEVFNYPIRRRSEEELVQINKIKRIRKIQLGVLQEFKRDTEITSSSSTESEFVKLLYHPLELTTKERRYIQAVLLGECILEIQKEFNAKFETFLKLKQDEISKIEERNERIAAIIGQLQLPEQVYHPELDEDEAPERIIEVHDSEVKVEKVLSEAERKKLDAKRLAQEERLRMNGEDNSRQRALMQMMGGKLEDRKMQEEKEEIVRPEWMNKPKEELTDEEKKLMKDFEKKMAIFKEEQEKQKKALETELRKLQANISEIQDQFDQKLHELASAKVEVDTAIFRNEVLIIKQTQYALECIRDDFKEKELNAQIEKLKQEKINYTNEIPEIKVTVL
jgi:WD40 repeat protein